MMDIKEKTKQELENRIESLERFIAKNGVGSSYLSRAESIQRNLNIGLFIGGIATIAGITAWAILNNNGKNED